MKYSEKLKDPRWQKKRLEILNRDNFTCTLCGDDKTELQIHHKSYHKEPWDALSENLTTLCKDCHGAVEENKKTFTFSASEDFLSSKKFNTAIVLNTKESIFMNRLSDRGYESIAGFTMDSLVIPYIYKLYKDGRK